MTRKCYICLKDEATEFYSSQVGPYSDNICKKCFSERAETPGFVEIAIKFNLMNNYLENGTARRSTVYQNGKYIPMMEHLDKIGFKYGSK